MKNLEQFAASKKVRAGVGILGALFVAALIFHAGVVVGAHRGRFDRAHSFRSPLFPSGFALPHGFIPNAHGAVGTITAVTLPTFTMETRAGASQSIVVGTSTLIRSMGPANEKALSVGSQVIVLGEPDGQGRIDAKLIRVLPSASPLP